MYRLRGASIKPSTGMIWRFCLGGSVHVRSMARCWTGGGFVMTVWLRPGILWLFHLAAPAQGLPPEKCLGNLGVLVPIPMCFRICLLASEAKPNRRLVLDVRESSGNRTVYSAAATLKVAIWSTNERRISFHRTRHRRRHFVLRFWDRCSLHYSTSLCVLLCLFHLRLRPGLLGFAGAGQHGTSEHLGMLVLTYMQYESA